MKNISLFIFVSASTIVLTGVLPSRLVAKPHPLTEVISQTDVSHSNTRNRSASILQQLNLSSQQKQKIRGILRTRSRQLAYVLTPAQRTKLKNQLDSGMELGEALKTVNVSASQKRHAATVIRQTNLEIESTLTPQQRQQVNAYLQQRHEVDTQDPID